jgi:hypothetical protein
MESARIRASLALEGPERLNVLDTLEEVKKECPDLMADALFERGQLMEVLSETDQALASYEEWVLKNPDPRKCVWISAGS